MHMLVLTFVLIFSATSTFAETVRPDYARAHVGQSVTVEGNVSEVYTARRSGVTFLDFGGRYPNNVFSAVIFADDAGRFSNVHELEGKVVDVTGPVRLYKGRPEIILRDAGQLKAK